MSERSVNVVQKTGAFDDLSIFLTQQTHHHHNAWLWLDPMAVIKKGTSGGKWQDFPIWSKLSEQVRWLEDAISQGLKISEGRLFFDQGSVHFVCTNKTHAGRYYQLLEQTNGESKVEAREEAIYQRQDVERYGFKKIDDAVKLNKITYWQGNRPIGWRIDVSATQPKAIIA
jgi:hypothetical protein